MATNIFETAVIEKSVDDRQRLTEIVKNVNRMTQGDLTKKIDVTENDNLKDLCLSINRFLLKIRGFINETTTTSDKVIVSYEELLENSESVKTTIANVNSAINDISLDMSEQMKGTVRSQNIINEIVVGFKEIVNSGNQIENSASSMMNTVEQSIEMYEELISKLNESAGSNKNLALDINELNENIKKIQSISDGVYSISRTTHLLSFNASIEAERANSNGLGFSVIANEMRRLASETSKQSEEIRAIINNITAKISNISSQMNLEVAVINKNIEASHLTGDNLRKIHGQSSETLSSVKEINKIIEHQNQEILNIQNIIEEIASSSQKTTATTEELAASSDDQLIAQNLMMKSIKGLIGMNINLKRQIAQFAKNYVITPAIQKYIDAAFVTLRELAQNKVLATMSYRDCTPVLLEAVKNDPSFELFGLIQKDGLRKAITLDYKEPDVYVSFAHRPYFKEAIIGNAYQSEPYVSSDTNSYCIAVAVPVRTESNQIVGVLIGDLVLG